MSDTIVPCEVKEVDIPLYQALGLTAQQSDTVYIEFTERIRPKCKTNAEALRAIIDDQRFTIAEKVWAAYNFDKFEQSQVGKVRGFVDALFKQVVGK